MKYSELEFIDWAKKNPKRLTSFILSLEEKDISDLTFAIESLQFAKFDSDVRTAIMFGLLDSRPVVREGAIYGASSFMKDKQINEK
jgi:hypothetical protein